MKQHQMCIVKDQEKKHHQQLLGFQNKEKQQLKDYKIIIIINILKNVKKYKITVNNCKIKNIIKR